MSENQVRIFSNGEEFAAFCEKSCWRCAKVTMDGPDYTCDLEQALDGAHWGEGTIPREMAARLGYPERAFAPDGCPFLGWVCRELEVAQ